MKESLSKTFLARIRTMSMNYENPEGVETAMRRMMMKTKKKLQAIYVKDLLQTLYKRNIGTAEVFHLSTKLCKENKYKRKEITKLAMKEKMKDAWKVLRKEKYEEQQMWRQLKKTINNKSRIENYNEIWYVEKNDTYNHLRDKRKTKIKWLVNKYYTQETTPETYNGVHVGDQVLDERFNITPECYGSTTISTNEERVLKIHPKYSVFDKICTVDCEAEIEKSLTKIRWQRGIEKQQNNNQTETTETKRTTFNIEKKEFNFKEARSTDLPFNSYVYMPKPLETVEEVKLQCLKNKILSITEEYANKNNNSLKNLSNEQRKGLKSLKQRQKNKEIVVFQTDKSGKMIVDSPENYIEAAKPHFKDDKIIDIKEYNKIEKVVNAHTICWLRMLRVAEDSGDSKRYKTSMLTHDSQPSTLYTYRKDHKEYEDRRKGPPVRPLCDVSDSYGHKLSYFISRILKEINDEQTTVCDSTEDMLAAIREANENTNMNNDSVIGSMDVKALYPSLDLNYTIEIVCQEFYKSNVKIEGVDYLELGLYLSLNRKEEYLRDLGIDECCPTRKNKVGAPPTVTGSGIEVDKGKRFKSWHIPLREPNDETKRIMLREALKIVLTIIMKNHTYNFNNELRKQKEGGAIGVDLTGNIANIFMSWWDKELIRKLEKLGITPFLYKRYVDDINLGTEAIKQNYEYVQGKLVERKGNLDNEIPADKKTFDIIRTIGDGIHKSIKLTTDVPSNHDDYKVPILDLKCWITEVNTGNKTVTKILHEHYIKDVSSKMVIHRESAMPINSKRTILTQQCLRILLNCHKDIGPDKIAEHLTFFMLRMQASGYDQQLRFEILKSAINAYNKMKEKEKEGEKIQKKRTWHRTERRKQREERKKNWYKNGNYESVLFLPSTPNSELRNKIQETINKTDTKIKVIEKSGTKIIKELQKNDPFKEKPCSKKDNCFVCRGPNPGNCRDTGVTYKINCSGECKYEYTGQTGQNAFTRGKKHESEYKAMNEESALWKHCVNVHNNEPQRFKMTVVDKCRNDATKRQILESVRINKLPNEHIMNSRSEWNSTKIPRISVSTAPKYRFDVREDSTKKKREKPLHGLALI